MIEVLGYRHKKNLKKLKKIKKSEAVKLKILHLLGYYTQLFMFTRHTSLQNI